MIKKAIRNLIIKRTFASKLRNKGMNTFSNFEILKSIRSSAEELRTHVSVSCDVELLFWTYKKPE